MPSPSLARFPAAAAPLLLAALLAGAPLSAAAQLPVPTPDDFGAFETLLAPALSPDGRWLAYRIRRVDETEELRLRPVDGDTLHVHAWGGAAVFSPDSRWAAWSIGMSEEERTRLQRAQEPIRNRIGLMELGTERARTLDAVRAFAFDPTGRYLVLHGYAPDEPEGRGADLRLLDLHTGSELHFGSVGSYAWSHGGELLALHVQPGGPASEPVDDEAAPARSTQAIHLYHPADGVLRVLDNSPSAYRGLTWREEALDLAVLRSHTPLGADTTTHALWLWESLAASGPLPTPRRLEGQGDPIPEGLHLTGLTPPAWTGDGTRIQLGLRPEPTPAAESDEGGDAELPGMQLWHTRDVRLIPQQRNQATAQSRRTLLAVWEPDSGAVVQVGTDTREAAAFTADGRFGVERLREPYPWGIMFGRPYMDVWTVDLATGERRAALERVRWAWESAEGRYLLTFDGTDYHALELATGQRANLTAGLGGTFANTEYDTPTDLLPPHGVGGWLTDDEAVIHRVVRLDTSDPAIDPNQPLYLSLRGEWTERRGYARILEDGMPTRLLFEDRMVTGLQRADSAEVYLWREEARDRSPNLQVAGAELANGRPLTDTNPFLGEWAWTRPELLDFESDGGERLQGVLLYPANHEAGRSYPMIVYTYEMLSQQMHQFQVPSERSYYNFTAWTLNGYFVLLPDIRYRARDPGVSALEALRPAIATVVDRGMVDPARVGLIGHSWGGYQATYLPTRTDLFAASVAGAPLTDFVSFMGQIHWTPGIAEVDHWETGQARMEVPYWEDPEAHHRNSPLHAVHEMESPLLMAFGDDDGVVEWWQGTVFYNFARRAERQMVLLVYEGEGHSFQRRPNQIDYHRRILEWFGHYLKGEPAPRWITDGVPWDEHEAEKRRVAGEG